MPALERAGGRFLLVGPCEGGFAGADEDWDLIAIGSYPDTESLLALYEDDAYRAAFPPPRGGMLGGTSGRLFGLGRRAAAQEFGERRLDVVRARIEQGERRVVLVEGVRGDPPANPCGIGFLARVVAG